MELFNTKRVAAELEYLTAAISTMEMLLYEKRLLGIATLVLELFESTDAQQVRIAVTEHENPNMFDMPGEERWLHCSVVVQPGNRYLDVPGTLFPARKLGEGSFEASRDDALIAETLPLWRENKELARLRLSQHLEALFHTVQHRTCVEVLPRKQPATSP